MRMILIFLFLLKYQILSASECIDIGVSLIDTACYPTTTPKTTQKTTTIKPSTSRIPTTTKKTTKTISANPTTNTPNTTRKSISSHSTAPQSRTVKTSSTWKQTTRFPSATSTSSISKTTKEESRSASPLSLNSTKIVKITETVEPHTSESFKTPPFFETKTSSSRRSHSTTPASFSESVRSSPTSEFTNHASSSETPSSAQTIVSISDLSHNSETSTSSMAGSSTSRPSISTSWESASETTSGIKKISTLTANELITQYSPAKTVLTSSVANGFSTSTVKLSNTDRSPTSSRRKTTVSFKSSSTMSSPRTVSVKLPLSPLPPLSTQAETKTSFISSRRTPTETTFSVDSRSDSGTSTSLEPSATTISKSGFTEASKSSGYTQETEMTAFSKPAKIETSRKSTIHASTNSNRTIELTTSEHIKRPSTRRSNDSLNATATTKVPEKLSSLTTTTGIISVTKSQTISSKPTRVTTASETEETDAFGTDLSFPPTTSEVFTHPRIATETFEPGTMETRPAESLGTSIEEKLSTLPTSEAGTSQSIVETIASTEPNYLGETSTDSSDISEIPTSESVSAENTKTWETDHETKTPMTKSFSHVSTGVPQTTTEIPERCLSPCEKEYFEGDSFCYIKVPTKNVRRYSFALAYCQQTQQADMADEFDFTSNVHLFQTLHDDQGSSFYFINEYGSKTMREDKSVRLIDLAEVTRFQVKINKTITVDTDEPNISALCRKPKYCEKPTCRLSLYYSEISNKLDLENNVTLKAGEERTINCKAPSVDKISVLCGSRGQIIPHVTLVQCTTPRDDSNRSEVVLPDNQKIRSSCSDCFSGGTQTCEAEGDGFVCSCKDGWTRFTCWKAPDLCIENSCEHGECISLIDKFVCVCYEGYGGERCEILKNLPDSMFSSATAVALASSATSSISLLQKFIRFRVVTGDVGDDPQEVFIGFRAVAFTVGTMMMSFFSHPNTMSIDPAACRFYNFLIYFCFLLAQTMSMNEALNLCTTMKGVNRNEWEKDSRGRKRWWISYRIRIGLPFIFSAACVSLIFCKSWDDIPSTWTCTGVYSEGRTSVWLPFAYLNVACVIGSLCFAECAVHIYNHSPMGLLNSYHFYDNRNPLQKNNIEKVVRNLPFVFVTPILLFFFFLTFSLNADNENQYLNKSYLIISFLYNLVFFLQILFTTPEVYDLFLKCLMRFCPPSWLPDHTPVTLLRPLEIREKTEVRNKAEDSSPDHPAHPGYLSREKKHFIKRRLTFSYIVHRLKNSLEPQEAVENVISEELHNRLIFSSLPGAKHMEIMVRDWANSMIAKDIIKTSTTKSNTRTTKEKFNPYAAKILNEKEVPNLGSSSNSEELKHLLDVLSFKPSQPGPFLRLPISNGSRTEQIYFTPKAPPRTKHDLRVMKEKFVKVIEKLNRAEQKKNHAQLKNFNLEEKENVQNVAFDSKQPGFIGPINQSDPRNMPGLKKYLEMEMFEKYSSEEWQRLEDHFDYFESIKINR